MQAQASRTEGGRPGGRRGGSRRPPARTGRRRRGGRGSTAARVLIAIPWALFAILIVWVGGDLFAFAMIGFAVLALDELYGMLKPMRPIPLAGFLGAGGLILAAHFGDQYQMVLVCALSVAVAFALGLARPQRGDVTLAMSTTLLGVFWIGLALAHAVLLRDLDHGNGLLVDVLIATFIGDTGAYFGGRIWGTRPLAPRISPGKTVEGLIAGFIAGTLAFWFAGLYQDWLSGIDALVIGACVAAAAPAGDLFESVIKRDAGVKDTGRLFGEHGGVLDRLDAAFFTVVVGYYIAQAVVA
jgi:phosphatidate cytidylyltransferase